MDQLVNVVLHIDEAHKIPHSAMDCRQSLGGLNQVYRTICPTHPAQSTCGMYISTSLLGVQIAISLIA